MLNWPFLPSPEPVRSKGYQMIKTFGVGKKTTALAWQLYIQQLIQQGIIELDYKDHYNLKLNPYSRKVLKGAVVVKMVNYEDIKERQAAQKKRATQPAPAALPERPNLYEHLRQVRKALADKQGKPAFVVFSNASLKDMSAKAPTTLDDFLEVSGVGQHKAQQYGAIFLQAIQRFQQQS